MRTRLYSANRGTLTPVAVGKEPSVLPGSPTALFDLTARAAFPRIRMDVGPDGGRILVLTSEGAASSTDEAEPTPGRIHVVLNWAQVLRDRVTAHR